MKSLFESVLNRRGFLKTLAALLLYGCAVDTRSPILREKEFTYLLQTLFPFEKGFFLQFRERFIALLAELDNTEWLTVQQCYMHFKKTFRKLYNSKSDYSLLKGERVVSMMLSSTDTSDLTNSALDIMYKTFLMSPDSAILSWEREYSLPGLMCYYWDEYDKPAIK